MKEAVRYGISFVMLLLIWWLISLVVAGTVSGAKSAILPGPLQAFNALFANWQRIGSYFVVSAYRLTAALLGSTLIGALFGLLIGFEDPLDRLLSPMLYMLFPLPKVVFLPLVLVLLGLNDWARIAFVFFVVVFQVLISARDAAKNISEDWILTIESAGGSKWQLYKHVVIPATLPSILTSARVSIGLGIAALYLAETTYANSGLGYYINSTWKIFAYPEVFAGILALGLLGLALYILIDILERIVCSWKV